MTREYKKSGIVGRIYRWVRGYYPSTNTCDVRKVVLFLALPKLVFNPRVADREYPLWVVYLLIGQWWVLAKWTPMLVGGKLPQEWMDVVFAVCGIAAIFEILAVLYFAVSGIFWLVGLIFSTLPIPRVRAPRGLVKATDDTLEHIVDWWDDFYHKVCKPVTWVD